jgi:hypothetical protein
MTTHTTHTQAHPVELALVAGLAVALAVRELASAAVALAGAIAGWRAPGARARAAAVAPAAPAAAVAPMAPAVHPIGERLAMYGQLRVRELRAIARAAGHRELARSGRRLELLTALGAI